MDIKQFIATIVIAILFGLGMNLTEKEYYFLGGLFNIAGMITLWSLFRFKY